MTGREGNVSVKKNHIELTKCCVAGFWKSGLLEWDYWEAEELKEKADSIILPEEWPPKPWKPSNENVKILEEYGEVLSDEYWDSWIKYSVEDAMKDYGSWVCSKTLRERLQKIGYPITSHVTRVLDYVENGVEIGCTGEGRLPTRKKNCPSAQVHGAKLADMIQQWCRDKICWGPLKKEELPWDDVSIAPLKAVPKPNGVSTSPFKIVWVN